MDRRNFLRTTGSLAAAAAAVVPATASDKPNRVAAPAIATGVTELGMAFDWPDNDQGLSDSARRLAQRIADFTDGRVRVTIRSGADAASAELRHGAAHDRIGLDAGFAFFGGLPGQAGLAAADYEAWLSMAGGQDHWDGLAKAYGVKSMLAGHTGADPLLWLASADDLQSGIRGKKIASTGLALEVIRGLGADPVSIRLADAAHGMSNGTLDGIEWGGAMHAHVVGIPPQSASAIGPFVTRNGTMQALDMNLKSWEQLTEVDRTAIVAAATEEYRLTVSEARFSEAMARRVAADRYGVVLRQVPIALHNAIDRISEAVVAHAAGSSPAAQRINASYMAFRALIPMSDVPVLAATA